MADIFISYSRNDRALAEELAADLKTRGFSIWWDSELLAADNFDEKILTELALAKAVIVIWSEHSNKSGYVKDEARYALNKKKLIATKTADLDVYSIPFGFQSQHTENITQRQQIIAAAMSLGVEPIAAPADIGGSLCWDDVRQTDDPQILIKFIQQTDNTDDERRAAERLMALGQAGNKAPAVAKSVAKEVKQLSSSNWSAFLAGLTFRLPEFSFASQSRAAAIGVVLGSILVPILAFFGIIFITAGINADSSTTNYIMILVAIVFSAINTKIFSGLFKQKSFVSGWIVGLFWVFIVSFLAAVTSASFIFGPSLKNLSFASVFTLLALAYVGWKYYRER